MNMKFEHADARKALEASLRGNNNVKRMAKTAVSGDL